MEVYVSWSVHTSIWFLKGSYKCMFHEVYIQMHASWSVHTSVCFLNCTYKCMLPKVYTQAYTSWSLHSSIWFLRVHTILCFLTLIKRNTHISTVLMPVEYDFVILINVWLFPINIFQAITKRVVVLLRASACVFLYISFQEDYFIFSKRI